MAQESQMVGGERKVLEAWPPRPTRGRYGKDVWFVPNMRAIISALLDDNTKDACLSTFRTAQFLPCPVFVLRT